MCFCASVLQSMRVCSASHPKIGFSIATGVHGFWSTLKLDRYSVSWNSGGIPRACVSHLKGAALMLGSFLF